MSLTAAAALVVACDTRHEPHAPLHYGASEQFDVESLDVYALGRTIHLLLAGAEPGGGKQSLRYVRSHNAGTTWSQPVRVNAAGAGPYTLHRGNDAQIAASGDRVVAVWQSEGTGWGGSGPLATAVSRDDGRSWRLGSNPADDGKTDGHGFIDIAADASGGFHLVWLDGRSGDQALYYAHSDDGGRAWSNNKTLDDLTCECCWNTLATSDNQVYALYRDLRPRDMAVTASMNRGNTWRPSTRVGSFNWKFSGCPHAGGGLAAVQDKRGGLRLNAIVWTGKEDEVGLYHVISTDAGRTWTHLLRLGTANAAHADIAVIDKDRVAAVWDTAGARGDAVFAAESRDGGRTWSAPKRLSGNKAAATHPRIVATPAGYRVFWTENANKLGHRWVMAEL